MSRGCTLIAAGVVMWALWTPLSASAQEADWPQPIHDDQIFWLLFAEQLEFVSTADGDAGAWDVYGWVGGDYDKIWFKSEGDHGGGADGGEFEVQALYSRLLTPFWDVQAGVRYDRQLGSMSHADRVHLALGFEGLAPYWFEMVPFVFISEDGDISARVSASYDLLLTQRLILQPEIEFNVSASTVEEWGIGSGFNDLSVDLRLRYEIRRELAPYVGGGWYGRFGETADLARNEGKKASEWRILAGVRIWF